jgi:hypothetical protein
VQTYPAISYPENVEVERLLFRARGLEQKHEYLGALALVNAALGVDPNSPSAATMRGRLEEIIKRI